MAKNHQLTGKKRLEFLEKVSMELLSSFHQQKTLQKIAELTVPALADYCRIVLIDEKKQTKAIFAHHIDPQKLELLKQLYEHYKDRPEITHGITKILETGKPEIIPSVPEYSQRNIHLHDQNPQLAKIANALHITSYIGVPLIVRRKVIGAIALSSTTKERLFTENDLIFIQKVAKRIALAIDNARLYKNAQDEAQKAIALRDDFISIASHELKTPITTLKLYTQILEKITKENGDKKSFSHLQKMSKQINKLTILSSDLLDASKLTHKKLRFTMSTFSLDDEIKDAIYAIQTLTTMHKIILEGKIGKKIEGDKHRIYQVITNLLTNAIKYSPDSHTIKVKLRTTADNVIVAVQNFGIGIEGKHLNKLFLQFYRVNTPEEKTFPGLGIGLYIANEIITKHGGKLTVSSERGVGSEFTFTLPFHQKF